MELCRGSRGEPTQHLIDLLLLQTMANSEYWTGNVKLTPSKAIPRF